MMLAIENAKKSVLFATLILSTKLKKGQATYDIVVSKVIHNSYNVHENYLTLNSVAGR
jgi:rod shape-determining protein MreC